MIESPNDTPVVPDNAIPQLPTLDVASYGDQETFLAMLENIVNGLVVTVNALIVAEFERERREGAKRIITVRDWSDGPRGPDL